MPLYRFICKNCGKEESLLLKYNQQPPRCSECDGELEKQISRVATCRKSESCSGCSGGNCGSCS